jgi:hypothetical protein
LVRLPGFLRLTASLVWIFASKFLSCRAGRIVRRMLVDLARGGKAVAALTFLGKVLDP